MNNNKNSMLARLALIAALPGKKTFIVGKGPRKILFYTTIKLPRMQ